MNKVVDEVKHVEDEIRGRLSIGTIISIIAMASGGIFAFASLQSSVSANVLAISNVRSDQDKLASHVWANKEASDTHIEQVINTMNQHDNQVDQRLARIEAGIEYLKKK